MIKAAKDITDAQAVINIIESAVRRNDPEWKNLITEFVDDNLTSYDMRFIWLGYRSGAPLGFQRRRTSPQEDDVCHECGSHLVLYSFTASMPVYPRDPAWLRRKAFTLRTDYFADDIDYDVCEKCTKRYL